MGMNDMNIVQYGKDNEQLNDQHTETETESGFRNQKEEKKPSRPNCQ